MARKKAFDPSERLETAKDLFWRKGYHATSMQDLVDAMKLHRGSIYDTYGNKHQLFLKSLKAYTTQISKEYKQAASGTASPRKAIEAVIQAAVQRTFREGKACMSVKSSFELAPIDEEVSILLKKQIEGLIRMLEELLVEAQDAGEIKKEQDPALLARFIVSSFSGFWQMYVLFDNKEMVDNLAELLLKKIG